MKKLVFIYSIPRQSEMGVSDWVNEHGIKINKTKVGKATDSFMALYSSKVGGLANHISYNPWVENGEVVTDNQGNKLTLQDKYEQLFNKPKGYYSNLAFRAGQSLDEDNMTYFQTKNWVFNDGCTVLDLSQEDDLMCYFTALDSKVVANSEKEWKAHKWPEARYYIALENEADEIKYSKNIIKSTAFANIHDASLTPTIRKKLITILKLASPRAVLTDEQIHNLLYEYIDKSDFNSNSNIDKFTYLYKLLSTAKGKEEFEARHLATQAVELRVIHEKQGTYSYSTAKDTIEIGNSFDTVVNFIANDKKFDIVQDIITKIDLKLK